MATLIRTIARGSLSGSAATYLMSFNWQPGTAGGSNTDATDCLARFRAMWFAMAGIMHNSLTINFDTTVLAFDPANGTLTAVYSGANPTSVAGTNATDLLPTQTQGLIGWNSNGIYSGKRVIGRTFVPAPTESSNTAGGQPLGSYLSGLTAGVTALLTAGSTASVPVVWSRPVDTPFRVGAGFQVLSGAARPVWSVQRGRR